MYEAMRALVDYNISAAESQHASSYNECQLTFIRLHALVHTRRKQFFVDEALIVFAHDLGIEGHSILDEPLVLADQHCQVRRQCREHERDQEVMVWVEKLCEDDMKRRKVAAEMSAHEDAMRFSLT